MRPFIPVFLAFAVAATAAAPNGVTRATLDNGLRIIIVRDALAPVVTVEDNYLVGGDETPKGFPGTAHALEHMRFRGCNGVTADQIAAILAQVGGAFNADTQQNITQYFVTLPSQDLDIGLRLDAACMADVQASQASWDKERGAIEQEVSRDLSSPLYKLVVRLNHDLFAGTPYEEDPLGTRPSFDQTTAAMLKKFWETWYAPNNSVLVITGDVDPDATLAKIKQYYGSIPRKTIPATPQIVLQPIKPDTFTLDSNLPYTLTTVAFRFPGFDSPDFAAARVLADVLASQRADLYGLVPQNKALYAGFQIVKTNAKASAALALGALPPDGDAGKLDASMQQIITKYATDGVPADLVEASKRSYVANAEFEWNSISNLAALWSQAVAGQGRSGPEEDVEAIKKVTLADVNRVAKEYLTGQAAVVGTLKPAPSGAPASAKGFGGAEQTTAAPTKPVQLPAWAESAVKSLNVPKPLAHPVDMKLSNGLRLIVQTETLSPTVTLSGSVKTQTQMEAPPGKDGVSDILEGLFSYGTKTLDRLAFQKALDDIAATETAGPAFLLKVLKQDFDRGVQLLADNELNPALPQDAFKVVQQQTAQYTAGLIESPQYRVDRALVHALLPQKDPLQREATPKTIMSVSYTDMTDFFKKTFRPDLTTIVIIGDISPEKAKAVVEKYFGSWTASGAKPDVVLPPVPANKPSAVDVPDPQSVQDEVDLAEELEMNRFSPDYYALQLGNHVLGGGFYATRLYRDIREKAGYVYSINNQLTADQSRAEYAVDYGCDPKNVSKARALVEQELIDMQKNNVSPGELQQAKALLLRQIQLRESSEDAIASGIIGRANIGLPLNEPFEAAKKYFGMSADQVRTAFAKWIMPNNFVQVVRGPAPQ